MSRPIDWTRLSALLALALAGCGLVADGASRNDGGNGRECRVDILANAVDPIVAPARIELRLALRHPEIRAHSPLRYPVP